MLRVVIDTNVVVSALISGGKPRELLRRGLANQFFLVTSNLLLNELIVVLRRPKFKTTEEEIHRVVLALIRSAEVVSVESNFEAVKEDPKDNIIIDTAYDGRADLIVTGDQHLLVLGSFKGIKIVNVENALKILQSGGLDGN